MKLNYKRVFLVGMAFFLISAFWQAYDAIVPLILTNHFGLPQTASGVVMSFDNILAVFLLPIFGAISDKVNTKYGRRTPFIVIGSLIAMVSFICLTFIDNYQLAKIADPIVPMIEMTAEEYAAYLREYAFNMTMSNPLPLVGFIATLLVVLVAMAIFRSPAVALMPDVTVKPLRSKANAIINLMGAVGGVLYLIFTAIMYPESKTSGVDHVNYLPLFIAVMAVIFISLMIMIFFVNEPKLAKAQQEYEDAHPEENLTETTENNKAVLPKPVKRSLIFLLLSVAFWYIGYNGIVTFFTNFTQNVWGVGIGGASTCLTIATGAAIVCYIPAGILASKIGRKKTIIAGALLLASSFLAGFIYTLFVNTFHPALYVLFALVGIAWATINVNSFPMVVEMCHGSDIGKFTGLYYTFSMAAQIVTPIIAGFLIEKIDYKVLFLYSAIFVFLSFITMCFVKHGDTKIERKKGLEAFDVD